MTAYRTPYYLWGPGKEFSRKSVTASRIHDYFQDPLLSTGCKIHVCLYCRYPWPSVRSKTVCKIHDCLKDLWLSAKSRHVCRILNCPHGTWQGLSNKDSWLYVGSMTFSKINGYLQESWLPASLMNVCRIHDCLHSPWLSSGIKMPTRSMTICRTHDLGFPAFMAVCRI